MEIRLKKQRNRLFLRIILLLLAVWLVISAVFCVVRLSIEKANVQSSELSAFSYFTKILSVGDGSGDAFSAAFDEATDLVNNLNDPEQKFDSQIMIIDRDNNKTVADTAGSLVVLYRFKWTEDVTANFITLLNYDRIRDSLTDDEYREIEEKLNTVRDDGNYYELVCTKFHYSLVLIPLELKLVLVNGKDPRRMIDDNVATFDLSENLVEDTDVYESGQIGRNTIPDSFILNRAYNRDYISSIPKERLKKTVDMIPTGTAEYIFYASDFVSFRSEEVSDDEILWTVRCAKKVNLLDNSIKDLLVGVAVIFGFFLTIALILCVMIWRTVKMQIIQEQKRADLTTALAHDIKTPLFVISGYAYSLKEDIDADERDSYLGKIIEQTEEINEMVHKMLSLSKLDSCTMTLNRTDFDLAELVGEITDKYPALPEGRSIRLTHSGDSVINADKELIQTAVQNLTDNAVKYSLPDSEIHVDLNGKTLCISNQSEPLTKADLKQIWQPYFRKDKSRHQHGNGLGLSIVKSILDLHQADYDVRQKDDVFSVTITFS